MKTRVFINLFLAAFLLLANTSAWACDAARPNTHIGPVTSVDDSGGTFTIIDAQTQRPISFFASKAVLKEAAQAKSPVAVSFREDNGRLIALDVH
ncbi:MAG: hypothetical protein ACE5DY_00385 [Mariprofundaceae bacterium]